MTPVFNNPCTNSALFTKLKSKTATPKRSNVVYKIDSKNCDGVYIGQTKRYLGERIREHKNNKKVATALNQHEQNSQHAFDFSNAKVLVTEKNFKARLMLEAIQIRRCPEAINFKSDVQALGNMYDTVLFE